MTWYELLVADRDELEERMVKLYDYMNSDTGPRIGPAYRHLLNKQYDAMTKYLIILNERIVIG